MVTRQKTTNKKKLRRQAQARAFKAGGKPILEPVRFSMMAKPIGPVCNLQCRYCFYLEKAALFGDGETCRMTAEVLEAYVRKYVASQPSGPVAFHWQGGEPTLMGLDFYRMATELQERYADGRQISNVLQTNGALLDDDWGRFLAKGRWLVGISLDGPADIHNTYRLDARGQGSFDAVMEGLDTLKRHRVAFNALASVTPAGADRPLDVYEFLKEAGATFIQFMPIVERMPDDAADRLGLQLAVGLRAGERVGAVDMTPWSVQPEAYGEFLCTIFDRWVRHDVGAVTVMNFEWATAWRLGQPTRVCQWMPECGRSPIIEHNGDIYACDHYVYPQYRLGNILTDDLQEMIQSPDQCAFGRAKLESLPLHCRQCPVGPACWGECPKRRFVQTPDGEAGLNYLCPAYRRFFAYAGPYLEGIAQLMQGGRPASDIMKTEVVVVPHPDGPPAAMQEPIY